MKTYYDVVNMTYDPNPNETQSMQFDEVKEKIRINLEQYIERQKIPSSEYGLNEIPFPVELFGNNKEWVHTICKGIRLNDISIEPYQSCISRSLPNAILLLKPLTDPARIPESRVEVVMKHVDMELYRCILYDHMNVAKGWFFIKL